MLPKDKMQAWAENDLTLDIRKQWVSHIGGSGTTQFPRDIGLPHRFSVSSLREMIDALETAKTHSQLYVQVHSDIEQAADVYDSIYIDIDAEMPFEPDEGTKEERYQMWKESLEDAYWEVKKYSWHMKEAYDAELRVYFSGSRGFSIYVDFVEVECDYGAVVSTIQDTLRDAGVDMNLVDSSVFEKNRISRLPYSLNWNHEEKRGLDPLLCLPIDPNWNFDTLLDEITDPEIQKSVNITKDENIVREYIEHRHRTGDYESQEIDGDIEITINPEASLERIETLMDIAEHIRDGRHRILHFMFVPALIEAGWEDYGQIHEISQEFIEKTGASYRPDYYKHVEKSIPRTIEGPPNSDGHWKPWTIQRFLQEYPELLPHFMDN